MSQTPGTGSSSEDRPPYEPLFAGSSAAPFRAGVQETVMNVEGRRLSHGSIGGIAPAPSPGGAALSADSELSRRLFPSDPGGVPSETEAAAGCELGHFAIEERIGAGGMGAVFRALDTRLQRVVALKVLSPGQSRDRAAVLRFENEARAAARLDHENIARVHYFGEDRGLYFIAFEYVTGQNVRDLIARTGRLPVSDAVNFTLQVATALRHTASAGVVHRDIKPSNIIIAPNGRAKLVDLGLARKLASDDAGDLTVAGTTLGTFDYISPEQARDPRNVDVRSDIYSLGCTLYHMLTGGPPYSSGTVLQKLLDHQSGQPPDPRTVNPQVSPALSAICRRMMAGDPRERYSTPDDLIRDLASVAGNLGLRPVPADGYLWSRPVGQPTRRVRSELIWAGMFAVVILMAIFADRLPIQQGSEPVSGDAPAADRSVAAAEPESRPAGTGRVSLLDDSGESSSDRRGDTAGDPQESSASTDLAEQVRGIGDVLGPILKPFLTQSGDASEEAAAREASPLDEERSLPPLQYEPVLGATSGVDVASREGVSGSSVTRGPVSETGPGESLRYGFTKPFVLWAEGEEAQGYDSLAAAVENASDGDTIELHFDGPPPGQPESETISVEDKSITIRSGVAPSGRRFRSILPFLGDPRVTGRSQMISVSGDGAALAIDGVEIRMTVTGEAVGMSRQWALFSMTGAEEIRLRDVGITLVNPEAWALAAFDLRPPEGISREALQIMGMKDESRADGFLVELENCLVRGGADLITIAHTFPGRIALRDSAFAIDTALLNVTGGLEKPPAGDTVDVRFDHVTAVAGGAVLQLDVDRLPRHATPIRVEARDSIFATGTAGPLVLMTGNATLATFEQSLVWNGQNNVFDGFSQFWTIFTEDGAAESAPTTFQLWKARWSRGGTPDPRSAERAIPPDDSFTQVWARATDAKNKSRTEVTASDLALDVDGAGELIVGTDGLPIGVAPEELPRVSGPPGGLSAAGRSGLAR